MSGVKYGKLVIDGVLGDVYDEDAVHSDQVVNVVLSILNDPAISAALLDKYHPIGSYYFTDRNVNPGTFLGGTWVTVEGRVLLGVSENYPVNSTGGSADAVIVEHSHEYNGATSNANEHRHSFGFTVSGGGHEHVYEHSSRYSFTESGANNQHYEHTGWYAANTGGGGNHSHSYSGNTGVVAAHNHTYSGTTDNTGESGAGKNMMPYKAAYIWVRTA